MVQVHPLLDAARLLHDLQQVKDIAQSLSGQLDSTHIARRVTDALVQQFDCAFARIWLLEPDQTTLRLVASSGLYTHTEGSFARVPMGAYKVGKIAQNRVPFLSNHLPQETWVKDRQWAIDNHIQGFAGYPLAVGDRVLGVLASFSHAPFAPEFLEVLQVLCMTVTVALDAAHQAGFMTASPILPAKPQPLSDQLAHILGETQLTLVGTERPLRASLTHALLQAAETLKQLHCSYCRLTYTPLSVALEAIAAVPSEKEDNGFDLSPCDALGIGLTPMAGDRSTPLADLKYVVTCLGGTLQAHTVMQGRTCQLSLVLPSPLESIAVQVQCRHPLLHQGFTQLAHQAGLTVCQRDQSAAVLMTDNPALLGTTPVLWIHYDASPIPPQATAVVKLSTTADQLRELVHRASQGQSGLFNSPVASLSGREQQVMGLLAEGKRDRDIAQELFISESTVKFHINNSLAKLKAKNRYQGVYQATVQGWI